MEQWETERKGFGGQSCQQKMMKEEEDKEEEMRNGAWMVWDWQSVTGRNTRAQTKGSCARKMEEQARDKKVSGDTLL